MSGSDIVILLIFILMIILSAVFSASETAYSTASKIRLTNLRNDGKKRASKVLRLIEKYDKVLSTVLIGNNIVNIIAATLSTVLFTNFMNSQEYGATVATIVTTIALLVFSEITPKTLAKQSPEKYAMALYPFVNACYYVLLPLTIIFSGWKKLLNKMTRNNHSTTTFTEDEIITIVENAENEGELEKHESELIRSAIEFEDLDVRDIMTPRVNVQAVRLDEDMEGIYKTFLESGFSRLPVYDQSIDKIVGIIHEKDFYVLLHDQKTDITPIIQKYVCVSTSMRISTVLSMLQKEKTHMAIVVDEFGGTEGIVTLEDILEELVGEIYDEHDEEEVMLKKLTEDTFIVSGGENFEEVLEQLEISPIEDTEMTTVGGYVTEQLDRIPLEGDKLVVGSLELEVLKANQRSVEEVKITKLVTIEDDDD